MTNADAIRKMTDDELVDIILWREVPRTMEEIPSCHEECENFGVGCAFNCPRDKKERSIRRWLKNERRSRNDTF